MNISTSLFFDRATRQMGDRQQALADVQAQLATAKRVVRPSSDPGQASAIDRLKSIIDRQDRHVQALVSAQTRLGIEESSLRNSGDLLTRIKELSLMAANGTYDVRSREIMAVEIDGMREQLLSLANTQDVEGAYVFAGARVGERPFDKVQQGLRWTAEYVGDQTRNSVAVGDHRDLIMNRSGTSVFVHVDKIEPGEEGPASRRIGFFEALDDLAHAVRNSDQEGMQQGLGHLDKMFAAISVAVTQVGTDLSVAEAQTQIVDETRLQMKSVLSKIEDLDYAEAVTRMQKELLALEAAQSSFAKIARLSLFEYIR